MKVVILQSNYLPWRGYFDLINDADVFCFYDEVQYTKNDWRNRNKIYSKNGIQWLTIPINKDAVKIKISQVELPPNWMQKHFNSLKLAYGRAPYFKELEELIGDIFFENNFKYLSQLNQYSIKKISSFIGIDTEFVDSKEFELKGDRVERLISLLKHLNATEYISGPAAKNYLAGHEIKFLENNIKLTFKDYSSYPEYIQINQPFENSVSIVDLIANVKREEINNYIWAWRQKLIE
jgi:hypothetical protein